jgi:hypothetical protein
VLVSLCYGLICWVLELVVLRVRSEEFKELEIVVLRARTRNPPAAPSGDHRRRPRVAHRRQPTPAARTLAGLHRHTRDAAALASAVGRPAVDVRASRRAAADAA